MVNPFLMNPTNYEAGLLAIIGANATDIPARKVAFEQFAKTGLPHKRMEAWKWTDLRSVISDDAKDASHTDEKGAIEFSGPSIFSQMGAFTITLDEEGASWGENVPAGVTIRLTDHVPSMLECVVEHPMANLAAAIAKETIIITVAAETEVFAPLHIRRIASARQHHCRILLSIDNGARLRLLETVEGAGYGDFFSNLVTECRIGEGAYCQRTVFSDGGDKGVDISVFGAALEGRAQFEQHALLLGGARERIENHIHHLGEESHAHLYSAAMLSGKRHGDITSFTRHDGENCLTHQHHKSVLRGRSHGVFQGKFLVERAGQKTDANMQANALLLSDRATVNHKPELEIYADDVECAHGSTSGALDEEAIFYMRQRGLNENAARALLVEAFLAEIFDEMDDESFSDIFRGVAAKWFHEASDEARTGLDNHPGDR